MLNYAEVFLPGKQADYDDAAKAQSMRSAVETDGMSAGVD